MKLKCLTAFLLLLTASGLPARPQEAAKPLNKNQVVKCSLLEPFPLTSGSGGAAALAVKGSERGAVRLTLRFTT